MARVAEDINLRERSFNRVKNWDISRLKPGTRKIVFGYDYDTADPHLDAILSLGPALCQSIQHLESGDSDTGRGNKITDQAVTKLAAALPNLLRVSLSGATRLSDKSLLVFFTHCPDLRHISIGGNDRVSGSVKGPALNALREQPNLSKKPDTLRLANQPEYNQKFNTAIKKVSAARKKLAIQVGCTGRGGLGVNTYIAGKMKDGHQALGGPGGFSRYGDF